MAIRARYTAVAALTTAMGMLAAPPAVALDLKYDTGAYLRFSDNINLGETDQTSDTVLAPFFRFEAEEAGARVRFNARGEVEYDDYLRNSFEDGATGKFSGRMNWAVLPQRLDFVVQDYLDNQPIDDLDAFNPGNRQQVNLLVAGPSLHLRFNPVTRAQIDARYGNTWAEDTPSFRGDRYTLGGKVVRELGRRASLSAHVEGTTVKYDDAGSAADYKRYDAFLGFTGRRSHLDMDVAVGYSRLELDRSGQSKSSPLVRAELGWDPSARSRLSANLRYQYADATQGLIAPTVDFSDAAMSWLAYPDLVVDPNVFRERTVKLAYRFTGERVSARLQPYYRKLDYVTPSIEDQQRQGALADIEYRMRPLTTVSLLIGHEERKYGSSIRTDRDLVLNLGLTHQFSRHWIGRLDVRRVERNSSADGRSYDANGAMLTITYRR